MTVFKAFLHVLNKCKGMVILYTALLLLFGGINSKSGDTASQFTADKPKIVIVNQDENSMQVHYVIHIEVEMEENKDLAGTFHITTTWKCMDD